MKRLLNSLADKTDIQDIRRLVTAARAEFVVIKQKAEIAEEDWIKLRDSLDRDMRKLGYRLAEKKEEYDETRAAYDHNELPVSPDVKKALKSLFDLTGKP